MAGGDSTVRRMFGYAGAFTTFGIFASPLYPTITQIVRNRTVGQQSAVPYLATLGNCLIWLVYGVVNSDGTVVTVNSVGALIEVVYILVFLRYSTGAQRRWLGLVLSAEVAAIGTVVGTIFGLTDKDNTRVMWFGRIGVVTGIAMYIAPVVNMWTVLHTHHVGHMSLLLCLASFANSICWIVYSRLGVKLDPYIFIPNLVGVVFAFAQLCVYAYFSYYGGNAAVANNGDNAGVANNGGNAAAVN